MPKPDAQARDHRKLVDLHGDTLMKPSASRWSHGHASQSMDINHITGSYPPICQRQESRWLQQISRREQYQLVNGDAADVPVVTGPKNQILLKVTMEGTRSLKMMFWWWYSRKQDNSAGGAEKNWPIIKRVVPMHHMKPLRSDASTVKMPCVKEFSKLHPGISQFKIDERSRWVVSRIRELTFQKLIDSRKDYDIGPFHSETPWEALGRLDLRVDRKKDKLLKDTIFCFL